MERNDLSGIEVAGVPAVTATAGGVTAMVECAILAGRFTWKEFFFTDLHNPHTQVYSLRAVERFKAWGER